MLRSEHVRHVPLDLAGDGADVVHGWRRAEGLAAPKAKSFRQVLIPAKPALTLRTILADSPYQDPEDLVFWGVSGRRPLGQRAILDVYREALEAIGIPRQEQAGRVLVPHSWRHGFTTGQRARGLPDAKLGKLTGHRTVRMVEHYGSHFEATDPDFKDAAEAAGRWLEGKA